MNYLRADDGKYYYHHQNLKSWNGARSTCRAELKGSRLATVRSDDTFRALEKYFPSALWLGGSDHYNEGRKSELNLALVGILLNQ